VGLFSKLKDLFTFQFEVLEDAPVLTPDQDRALAVGAVYAAEGGLPINAPTMTDPKTAAKLLSGAWDISGPTDVDAVYEFLLHQGHRAYYAIVAPRVEEAIAAGRRSRALRDQHKAQAAQDAAARGLDPQRASDWYDYWTASAVAGGHAELVDPLPAGIAAWDAARVVQLSRLLLDAGYVTPERAWSAMSEAAEMSRPAYSSWKEFGDAFVVGRAFWSAGNRNPIDQDVRKFKDAVDNLLTTEGSPWLRLAF
jgi:hypothetical protein